MITKSRIARIAGIAAGFAFAIGAVAPAAQAVTVADLQAQIASLMAQLQSLQGGSSSSVTFSRNLTVGSSGADVTALQNWLISKGYSISAGATGFFGAQTKAAVARWQASAGISPAAGFFGPVSRNAVNSMAGGSVGGTTTGGTVSTGGSTGGSTGITTPGVEGILTVTAGPLSNSVLNVGQTMVPVLTIRAQAQTSDIAIQRVTVDLGSSTNIFNKIFSKIYIVDNASGQVLASSPLNNTTVIQSGANYLVTIGGFNLVVPHGSYRDLAVKADLYSSIDSIYVTGGTSAVTDTFTIDTNGVRGIDGAGIDQYGPSSGSLSQTVTVNKSLVDNAQANLSLSASSPLTNSVPVNDTTNGAYQQLPVMAFQVNAQNDTLHLHQVEVDFTGVPTTNTTATATAAYLYNGSTQVASASINSSTGVATFSNITDGTAGATIPVNTTATYTVKADVTGVTSGSMTLVGKLNTGATKTLIYNSIDSSVTNSGSANGNTLTILGKGPSLSINSTSINAVNTQNTSGNSTTTITATFNVGVTAVGGDVLFGTQASATPMFVFGIYKNGTLVTNPVLNASSTAFTVPSNVTNDTTNKSFTLSQGNSTTIPVSFTFDDRLTTGSATGLGAGQYTVDIEKVQYVVAGAAANQTFMAGQQAWTTSSVAGLQ